MGIDSSAVQFLCGAKNHGVDFRDTLTIGRHNFHPRRDVCERALKAIGSNVPVAKLQETPYSDAFLKVLGAESISAMDYSDFEGADVIHDLNKPIPAELRNRYGVVFDGGTVEHVFNISQAYKNFMEMVRVGGWFLQLTVGNNALGHGFWQISPETLFRCFSPENGFETHAVLVKEVEHDGDWYAAKDPASIGHRVELRNVISTYVGVLAKKVADVEVFAKTPQQSDYQSAWSGGTAHMDRPESPPIQRLGDRLSAKQRSILKGMAVSMRLVSPFSPACYHRLSEAALLRGDMGPAPTQAAGSRA